MSQFAQDYFGFKTESLLGHETFSFKTKIVLGKLGH